MSFVNTKSFLLLFLAAVILCSCGSPHCLSGVSIEKRKYRSGWYVRMNNQQNQSQEYTSAITNEIAETPAESSFVIDSIAYENLPTTDTTITDERSNNSTYIVKEQNNGHDSDFSTTITEKEAGPRLSEMGKFGNKASKAEDPGMMILGIFLSMLLSAFVICLGLFFFGLSSIFLLVIFGLFALLGIISSMYFTKKYDDYGHDEVGQDATANPYALISIILCVVGLILRTVYGASIFLLIACLIFSIIALAQRAKNPKKYKDTWLALFPFVLAGIAVLFLGFYLFFVSMFN